MSEQNRTRLRPVLAGLAVLLLLAFVAAGYWWFEVRGKVSTDDARLAGDLVDIGAEIPARITEVDVDVGDTVHAGDRLFRLDRAHLEAGAEAAQEALALAESRLAAAQANLAKARHGPRADEVRMARAAVDRLQAQAHLAQLSLERTKQLQSSGSASRSAVDEATAAAEVAQSSLAEARRHLALLRAGTRQEDLDALAAQVKSAEVGVEQARTALTQAEIALAKGEVSAPFDGVVVRRWRDAGDTATPGAPVLTLFDPGSLRVDANVEETSLSHVRPGAPVDISVDAFPGLPLEGRVGTIVRATQSQLSPIPSEGVSGTFIKVTQRVPVRIRLEDLPPGADAGQLLPGLSVEVRIHEAAAAGEAGPAVAHR